MQMGVIAGGIARVSVDAAERKKIMFEVRSFRFCRLALPLPTFVCNAARRFLLPFDASHHF